MSDFQDGFFRDLWYDMMINESHSVLCNYFREEKKDHILVKLKKCCYELSVPSGYRSISLDLLKEAPELKNDKKQIEHYIADKMSDEEQISLICELFEKLTSGKKKEKKESEKHVRKGAGEHACIEILCRYYDFLTEYAALCIDGKLEDLTESTVSFLEELRGRVDAAKTNKRKKRQAIEMIDHAVCHVSAGTEKKNRIEETDIVEKAVDQVIDLYLYAEAAQFLYNAGYPLPCEDGSEEYGKDIAKVEKRNMARIKTVSLKLLDYYFEQHGLSFEQLTSVSRRAPSWIAGNEAAREKMEEVYHFACDNNLKKAVIPLMIDNASGSGLYIIGENYLQSWGEEDVNYQKVEEILDGRPCCYAIVKFLNLELEDGGQYFWAPYSMVDLVYGKCDTNPEEILFHDLETALNIYQGQLAGSAQEVLYENFRSENIVHLKEDDVTIDPEFRKYFKISEEEDLSEEIRDFEREYRRRWSMETK